MCFRDENGSWTGLVGALVAGDVDISVAALTMTTEREEVIDYVAPYYDQVGTLLIFLNFFMIFLLHCLKCCNLPKKAV